MNNLQTNSQVSIFEYPTIQDSLQESGGVVSASFKSNDIRTDGQKNNKIAFDVGEKIGGARKDLASQREKFLSNPSSFLLDKIEKSDATTAAELMVKDTFFKWFSLEDCKARGVEPGVAKAMQLIISRIPKESKDSAEERQKYMNTMRLLSDLLKTVTNTEEYSGFEHRIIALLNVPASDEMANYLEEEIQFKKVNAQSLPKHKQKKIVREIENDTAKLFLYDMAKNFMIREYEGPFKNYFYKHQSRVGLLKSALSVKSWEELLSPKMKNGTTKAPRIRKPVWERTLPGNPKRNGGASIHIEHPNVFINHFGFRSSEFGHYVSDQEGQEHLLRSAEAFTDLADILEIPYQSVSLNNQLAMAFGSRGSGRALGHYEPLRRVINLTKTKGSLGVLAHEWFHSLDHFLYNHSYDFKNGKVGYLTNLEHGELITDTIKSEVELLIDVIKVGNATAYIDVTDYENKYVLKKDFKDLYEQVNGDLLRFMDYSLIEFDEHLEWSHRYRTLKVTERTSKQRQTFLRRNAEALAQHHFQMTGQKISRIPYPTKHSVFYQNAINLDKGKIGKYWSSNVELAARAFEYYISRKLKERGWTSDYLVCGLDSIAYPYAEDEANRIYNFMDSFINSVRSIVNC